MWSVRQAGVLPPHPHCLAVAARNREALIASVLTSDVLEEAEKDKEAEEEKEENIENRENLESEENKENEEDKKNDP